MSNPPKHARVADEAPRGSASEPDDAVGYRRPPVGHRWKPGQSGNPKGRPRGAKSMSTILGEELDRDVEARVGGRLVKMSRRRAAVQKQVELALKGDSRAFLILLKLDPTMAREMAEAEKAAADEPQPLGPEEARVYRALLQRHTPADGGQP